MDDAKLLNAFINDPSALAQFAAHLLDAIKTKLGWSDADVNPVTFGEMTDDQLLSHLSEFLGSGISNTNINGGFIEAAQEAAEIASMTDDELAELDNSSNPRVIAAKLRKAAVEAAQDAADREHERRMEERQELTKQEIEILSHQTIKTSHGNVTSLDIVRATDKMLDDWDNTFVDMVAQGIAKPDDKNKLYKTMRDYNKFMRDPNKSEQEKQAERDRLLREGILTKSEMEYVDQKSAQERDAKSAEATAELVQRAGSTRQVSVEERKEDFSASTTAQPTRLFASSVSAEIKTDVSPTSEFNTKAANVIALETQKPVLKEEMTNTISVSNVGGNIVGFG